MSTFNPIWLLTVEVQIFNIVELVEQWGGLKTGVVQQKIVSSIFIGNQALSGGAIFSNGQGNTIIVNSTFRENKAICNKAKCYYGKCRLTEE